MKTKIFFVLLITAIIGCITVSPEVTEKNVAPIYNPGSTTIHPKLLVFHKDTISSLLYIYLYTPELLFLQTSTSTTYVSKVRIYYKIIESYASEQIIDSATTYINLKKNESQSSLVTFIKLKNNNLQKYILQVLIKDEYRKKSNIAFIEVDKTKNTEYQNFLISYEENLVPTFNNYFYTDSRFVIQNSQTPTNLYITRYELDTTLPMPPFATKIDFKNFIKDTTWKLEYNNNVAFDKNQKGIYFFQTDSAIKKGKTFTNFGEDFPNYKTADRLFEGLVYLVSSAEYDSLKKIGNKKMAVDNFWLNIAPDMTQAKEMIRIYYSRMVYSNIYFTSYKEGWKTDMGMIYMVFGPPKIVHKKDGYERWTYSDTRSIKVVNFDFYKNYNSISENEYILKRDVSYKNYWQNAIKTWKNGKIFSLDY